ncbi:MAG: hypothetical protein MK008_09900 [Bdellovibrionales bacterium]|nr:hypothetical protein [Bdellovibrionales bacterium]
MSYLLALLLSFNLGAKELLQCSVNSGPLQGQGLTLSLENEQVTLFDKTNTRLLCKKTINSDNNEINLVCGEGFFQSSIKILPDGLGSIKTMNIESRINCESGVYLSLKGEKNQTKDLSR